MSFKHITLDWSMGMISEQFKEAHEIACLTNRKVTFEFQKVKWNITKLSSIDDCYDKHRKALVNGDMSIFGKGW